MHNTSEDVQVRILSVFLRGGGRIIYTTTGKVMQIKTAKLDAAAFVCISGTGS